MALSSALVACARWSWNERPRGNQSVTDFALKSILATESAPADRGSKHVEIEKLGLSFALALALGIAVAKPPAPSASAASTASPAPATPQESQLVEHSHYVNKSGSVVHSPAHSVTGQEPPGASAKCRDGTFSFSQHHQGTCSHHGGVASWL